MHSWRFAVLIAVLSSLAVCQPEVFQITANPSLTDGRLCLEDVTFNCTIRDVAGIGSAIRVYFNNETNHRYLFIFSESLQYPRLINNDSFLVVVQDASLNADRSSVNVELLLTASYQLLQDMGIWQLHCGRSLELSRSIDITGIDDMTVPNLEVQSFIAVYKDSSLQKVELQLSGQVYNTTFCTYKMNTNVTVVARFNGVEVYSFSRELCREQSCQFNIDFSSGSQTADTVYISLSNSLMASSNQTIPVPQQEFNIAFEFNNDSCMLKVECKNDTEAVVDCMLSSNTSGILGNGTVIIPVKSDDRYEFQGTMRSIRVSQSHQVTGTESCASTSGGEGGGSTTGVIVVIVIVVVVILVVLAVLVVIALVFVVKRRKNKSMGNEVMEGTTEFRGQKVFLQAKLASTRRQPSRLDKLSPGPVSDTYTQLQPHPPESPSVYASLQQNQITLNEIKEDYLQTVEADNAKGSDDDDSNYKAAYDNQPWSK